MADTPTISMKEDGPLLVANGPGLTDAQGQYLNQSR